MKWTGRHTAIALTVAATMVALVEEFHELSETLEEQRAYQVRETQEGLSALHRDLLTVNHLSSINNSNGEGEEYLAARREAFSSVRWLGLLPPGGSRARVLLSSSEARGYDPVRDPAVLGTLSHLREGETAVAIPTTHRNLATMALILAPDSADTAALIALVDGDDLLDDSLRALDSGVPMRLIWGNSPLGNWPHPSSSTWGIQGEGQALSVAAMEFRLGFAELSLGERLSRIPPLPLLVLATGLAAMALAQGRRQPMPPPPAPPIPETAPAPPDETSRRDRLWRLGELAATLSHDLGQPLNIIRLTSETAADSLASGHPDPARLRRSLDIAMEQTQRAQGMLDTVIAASRRPSSPAVPVSAVECVRQALARQLPAIRAQGIRLTWHADAKLPPVRGHAHRLEAAIWHLLVNACEALAARRLEDGSGSGIWVECRADHRDSIAIVIADDGPGLSSVLRTALSDPNASAATLRGKGCGLGMTVAQGVAEEMGGRLHITDNPGGGARMVLSLPARPQTLLLAEDEATAAAELAESLRARGWRVMVAHGGRPALALFQQEPADAVVTDLHMPDGDGWYLLEKLHALAPDLPMVAISTVDGAELRRAVAAGAAITLRKPVSADEIADALAEIMEC